MANDYAAMRARAALAQAIPPGPDDEDRLADALARDVLALLDDMRRKDKALAAIKRWDDAAQELTTLADAGGVERAFVDELRNKAVEATLAALAPAKDGDA